MTTSSAKKLSPWEQACKVAGADPEAKYSPEHQADIVYRASCKMLRLMPDSLPDCTAIHSEFHGSQIALYKLQVIRRAVVGKWEANWNDGSYKWGCWFWLNAPGFRFGGARYDVHAATWAGGSRLCFQTRRQAEFVGRYCLAIFRDLLCDEDFPLALVA